jgi:glucokinase
LTLIYNEKEVAGIVKSEEYDSGKKRSTAFLGTRNGNELTVSFKKGDPPVIGDASEWTNKPWTLKKDGAKEILHIIFKAKNFDTNKWEETDYQFVMVDCN